MFSIPGYRTSQQLHESDHSLIFRAVREADQLPVVLKVLKDVHPPPERIARFRREHEIVRSLDLPGVVRAHDFLHTEGHWLFVQEDFGAESLARSALAGQLDVEAFLSLAEAIAGHVASIHQRSIIHKDLNPANIVRDPRTSVVKIIDFGIATRLSRESVAFDHPSLIEGTPAYLSPEQTGRMSHALDHRSDLYSIGCTFYELLAGRPPFEATDLAELLHCHLVRVPAPVRSLRADVPEALSGALDKLLAKNPGDRYQTAQGLRADLAAIRRELREHGKVTAFVAGKHDVEDRLSPPARLYGRDAEIAELTRSLERTTAGGTELFLVSGQSGAGKTALVRHLYRPLAAERGFFVSGKFDQLRRDTPYGPILSAMDSLVGQVLMEPPARVARWARAIGAAAGGLLPSVSKVLPRLGLLFAHLPPAAALPGPAPGARFLRALAGILRAFAAPEHPLVLFVDDLQWADGASLDLLRHLFTVDPIPHLLVLGAYRDNEAPPAHPLRVMMRDIRDAGTQVGEISVPPLGPADTSALLADVLHRDVEDVREASAVLHEKTLGNPFFLQTYLRSLVADGVVWFDHDAGGWRWNTDSLRTREVTDNVVELLLGDLRAQPGETRDLLLLAASIGNQASLSLLAAAAGRRAVDTAAALTPALAAGYLIPTSGDYRLLEAADEETCARLDVTYRFAHDRVQQAAYDLCSSPEHASLHLRVGRAMLGQPAGDDAPSRLLSIVGQLNRALPLVTEARERREIASMNLEAGQQARASAAHAAALEYFERGLGALGTEAASSDARELSATVHERAFQGDPSLALALTEEAADAAYLTADFEKSDRYADAVVRHAERLLDRIKAMQVRVHAQTARNQMAAAVTLAREILDQLGIRLPESPTEADVTSMYATIDRAMGSRSPRELVDLPPMDNAQSAAALRMLFSIFIPVLLSAPPLLPLIGAHMVLLTLESGLADESIHGFLLHGWNLCGREEVVLGNEFGRLAEALVDKLQAKSRLPDVVSLGGAYVFHWQRPLRDSIQAMRDGYRAGMESGNLASGVNCLQGSTAMAFLAGVDLGTVDSEYTESTQVLVRFKQGPYLTWLRQYHQAVRNFRGMNDDPTRLSGDVYDEIAEVPIHEKNADFTAIYMVNFNRMLLCYHFRDHREALRCARAVEGGNQPGSIYLTTTALYRCLAALAVHDVAEPEERAALLGEARDLVDKMARWSRSCPVNYAHKHHLMAAELARVTGRIAEARDHYDRAIDLAREHEYTQEEALALERAALFYLEQKNARLAGHYMRDAHYTYGRWGAAAKQERLRREHGHLLESEGRRRSRGRAAAGDGAVARGTGTSSELGELDLDTVLSASRALARETDVGGLLRAVMRVSLTSAGAERGFLILVRGDQLIVKVRGELGESACFEPLSISLQDQEGLSHAVVRYVARTGEPVLLARASKEGMFVQDPHIRARDCRSLLCIPILSRGSLVAITYLENNRAEGVFDADRLDVLTLLMGQAAVSIESALLREAEDTRDLHFRLGGSLPADSPLYVRRKADDLLMSSVQQGELCYVFNTRQMGKSSLRVRTSDRLSRAGVACASIDITSIGSNDVTAEQWYAGMARALVVGLGQQKDLDLRRWWRERAELSPVQRLDLLVDEVLLERVDRPIAVFIDEVDAVLGLGFSPDDFFALIRLFYNRRAEDPRYRRLSFVLLGVATPGDLIRDKRRTPFNIGRPIPLAGFRFDESRNLVPFLARAGDGERLLRSVLEWSGGQPFLTQKLCQLVVEDESRPPAGKERDWVATLVQASVIDNWRHRDEPEHLKTIEARILRAPGGVRELLSLYRRIRDLGEIDAGESPVEEALVLSGLVTQTWGKLRVGNPIYATVFDDAWIDAGLAAQPGLGAD